MESSHDEYLLAIQRGEQDAARANYEAWKKANPEFAAARDHRLAAQKTRLDNAIYNIFFNSRLGNERTREYGNLSAHTYAMTATFNELARSAEEIDKHMIPVISSAAEYLEEIQVVVRNAQLRRGAITLQEKDALTKKEAEFREKADAAKAHFQATGAEKALGLLFMILGATLAIGTLGCCTCLATAGYNLFTGRDHTKNINRFQQSVDRAGSDLTGQSPRPK